MSTQQELKPVSRVHENLWEKSWAALITRAKCVDDWWQNAQIIIAKQYKYEEFKRKYDCTFFG